MNSISAMPQRQPRRGELNAILTPQARVALRMIWAELQDLHRRAETIDDPFLVELIAAALDEARDQLRDDMVMREREASEAARLTEQDPEA